MPQCPRCAVGMPDSARFCPACGSRAVQTSQTHTAEGTVPYGKAGGTLQNESVTFVPGALLAGRFRIVSLLGRGGMGEVYRADDLQLGHPVALKFLSQLSPDPDVLERFYAEVRLARQVAHPHVCRVYDIGEFEGRRFLSMEYVDGEDLASLLRRIGRLSPDKALDVAHQLCAGLAAAHDAGILHRDLKPANILIDGRGRIRITDFGLARQADHAATPGEFAGTPAYMSPEQLREGTHSARSDLYALGLVLYEVFTGRRPFDAASLGDWTRAHLYLEPAAASVTGHPMDPAVERVIMRCLQKDPALRPASALQVLAALPGGDPLAAALAAGEMPSPETVAAAGERAGIRPRSAAVLLGTVLALLATAVPLSRNGTLLGVAPLAKSPDVFAARAQEIVTRLGYDAQPQDKVLWIRRDPGFLRYWFQHVPPPSAMRELRAAWPGPYELVYRQSPDSLATREGTSITETNPAPTTPGMVTAVLNNAGQLMRFEAVPPAREEDAGPAAAADWTMLLAEAGLASNELERAAPLLVPRAPFDSRAAWTVTRQGVSVQVDAAAFRGKPVYFAFTTPWSERRTRSTATRAAGTIFSVALLIVIPLAAAWMARRNIRSARGDLAGARRLAMLVGIASLLTIITGLQSANTATPVAVLLSATRDSLFMAALVWICYIALEPPIRRRTPHLLIAWTRLLAGKFTDPLIGRDVLIGVVFGALMTVLALAIGALPWWFRLTGIMPVTFSTKAIGAPNELLSFLFQSAVLAVLSTMVLLFLYTGLLWLLRRRWLAASVAFAIMAVTAMLGGNTPIVGLIYGMPLGAITLLALLRFGPVAVISMELVRNLLAAPTDLNMNTWYAGRSALALSAVALLAAVAFHYALAGRRLLPADEHEAAAKAGPRRG